MKQGYRIIDTDTHVGPNLETLVDYAGPALRARWDELDSVAPDAWTVRNVSERLNSTPDPWAGIEDHAASIDRLRDWVGGSG